MKPDKPPRDLLDWLDLRRYPDWRVARPLGKIFGMAASLLLLMAFAAAFFTVYRAIWGDAAAAGGSLGAGALIVALLGAPFLIWGTVIKHQTLRAQIDGQITDRIAKAVEQLGAEKVVKEALKDGATVERTKPNIEVRIGGILSLERIAQDSTTHDQGRDHVRVMEILCAYVRENAKADTATAAPAVPPDQLRQWAEKLPPPRTDIAIALQVIGRRNRDQRKVEAAGPKPPTPETEWVFDHPPQAPEEDAALPLEQTGEYLDRLVALITMVNYHGYRLDLRNTNLRHADLLRAVLSGAQMSGAHLEGAYLGWAHLKGAYLRQAHLEGADLWQAHLEGADLGLAHVEGAYLGQAHLEGAGLWLAHLEGANLLLAHLKGASLWLAHLEGASFASTHLEGVHLEGAHLDGTGFRDVDLAATGVTQGQLDSAFGDGSVVLPDHLTRPAHWPDWELPLRGPHDFGTEWRKWQSNPAAYTPPEAPPPEAPV